MAVEPGAVAAAHNAMAAEYDRLDDLWYPWLYTQIHRSIAAGLHGRSRRAKAVDAGCGTGFQAFLLAQAGFDEVTGFDIATDLLAAARAKSAAFSVPPLHSPPLFQRSSTPEWLGRAHADLARRLERLRAGRPVRRPAFVPGDIATFDFGSPADVITCCGSVLSFVDSYDDALRRMAAALEPGGLLFLEVEQKVTADLLWPIADRLLGGRLEYEQSWRDIGHALFARPGQTIRLDYPFRLATGEEVMLPLWLFAIADLERAFMAVGLRIRTRVGVHQATNLLPSTLLHRHDPSRLLDVAFNTLRPLDAALAGLWPFRRLGCSVVYCLERTTRG